MQQLVAVSLWDHVSIISVISDEGVPRVVGVISVVTGASPRRPFEKQANLFQPLPLVPALGNRRALTVKTTPDHSLAPYALNSDIELAKIP
jgi:hypothetical protein